MKNSSGFLLLLICILTPGLKITAQDSVRVKANDSTLLNLQDSLKQFENELDELMQAKKKSYFQIELMFLSNNVFLAAKILSPLLISLHLLVIIINRDCILMRWHLIFLYQARVVLTFLPLKLAMHINLAILMCN